MLFYSYLHSAEKSLVSQIWTFLNLSLYITDPGSALLHTFKHELFCFNSLYFFLLWKSLICANTLHHWAFSSVQLRPYVESPDKWNDTAVRHLFIRHDETVLGSSVRSCGGSRSHLRSLWTSFKSLLCGGHKAHCPQPGISLSTYQVLN